MHHAVTVQLNNCWSRTQWLWNYSFTVVCFNLFQWALGDGFHSENHIIGWESIQTKEFWGSSQHILFTDTCIILKWYPPDTCVILRRSSCETDLSTRLYTCVGSLWYACPYVGKNKSCAGPFLKARVKLQDSAPPLLACTVGCNNLTNPLCVPSMNSEFVLPYWVLFVMHNQLCILVQLQSVMPNFIDSNQKLYLWWIFSFVFHYIAK
jgi:hypothetical protein